jgi:hypothetical protein
MSEEYNGHPTWRHWNVSLWIGNTEGLYHKAVEIVQQEGATEKSAKRFIEELAEEGVTQTPDGAEYTWTTVLAALEGFVPECEAELKTYKVTKTAQVYFTATVRALSEEDAEEKADDLDREDWAQEKWGEDEVEYSFEEVKDA